jgi:hypothetical protein
MEVPRTRLSKYNEQKYVLESVPNIEVTNPLHDIEKFYYFLLRY